jgi:hypothetical protein
MVARRKHAWLASLGLLLAFGCGSKFVGVNMSGDAGAAGAEPDADAGESGSAAAGSSQGGPGGRGGNGGTGPRGGQGGASSGAGGVLGIGGVLPLGGGGVGGSVELPDPPQDGLELWFDAQVGVTLAGGSVFTWKDRSANERDAAQINAGDRPTLSSNGLNGKPTLVFDGKGDFLLLPSLPGNFDKGVSVFVIGQWDAETLCAGFFEASNGSEIDDVHLGQWQGRHLFEIYDPYIQAQAHIALGEPMLSVGRKSPMEAATLRLDGKQIGVGEDLQLPVNTPREQVFLGKTLYGNCTSLPGRISEVLVYSRAVSTEEQADIEDYLQTKWACCGN